MQTDYSIFMFDICKLIFPHLSMLSMYTKNQPILPILYCLPYSESDKLDLYKSNILQA